MYHSNMSRENKVGLGGICIFFILGLALYFGNIKIFGIGLILFGLGVIFFNDVINQSNINNWRRMKIYGDLNSFEKGLKMMNKILAPVVGISFILVGFLCLFQESFPK